MAGLCHACLTQAMPQMYACMYTTTVILQSSPDLRRAWTMQVTMGRCNVQPNWKSFCPHCMADLVTKQTCSFVLRAHA